MMQTPAKGDDSASEHPDIKMPPSTGQQTLVTAATKPPPPTAADTSNEQQQEEEEESETDRRRRVALEQADAVLEAIGGDYYLDGFNLLGVVANPRGSVHSLTPASYHGRYSTTIGSASSHGGGASHAVSPTSSSDVFTETYHSLEVTLGQVTEQIEAFNHMLEDWSRHILEDDAFAGHGEELPDAQLRELPEAFQTLNLEPLQSYLEQSGMVAHAFEKLLLHRQQQQQHGSAGSMSTQQQQQQAPSHEESADEIPPIFFREDFDLTDPQTFSELLIAVDPDSTEDANHALDDSNDDRPVSEWFPLLPPDAFGDFLDKVEVSLLHQVRSKSGKFFAESLRFAQLQEWIQSLLKQVLDLQETVRLLRHDLLEPMDVIPRADEQRRDLRRLLMALERADDLLRCKASLVGVLSAQDDLTAIEQIQYGRRLLAGTAERGATDDTTEESIELGRLQSLKAVSEQLNQYEQLVVTKLRDELVEIFLGWNTAAVSSVYALNGGSTKSTQHVRDRVREIMGALKRCHALSQTREAYSHRLQDMIRMTVRTTVGEFAADASASNSSAVASVSAGATAMSLSRFLDCLDMLFEQLLGLMTSATGVDEFCVKEGFSFLDNGEADENSDKGSDHQEQSSTVNSSDGALSSSPMNGVVAAAAELCSKSISELLRLRKEAHSLVTLEEMKSIWDTCVQFTVTIEKMSGRSSALRSTLLAQAKAFVERKHESNMAALVAALDSERWTQCEVSAERQEALTRLCTGRSLISSTTSRSIDRAVVSSTREDLARSPEAEVEGTRYKVVWSCLLLVEMMTNDVASAVLFSSLTSGIVGKVAELLRLFNSRTTHLVLGAGAIHSNAKLKSINAKHLSLVTQCLGMIISILPHIRAALMAQMPKKQHNLLNDLDQIRREYADHNEKVLNKFVTIIGGIVEHGLAPKIAGTDFDARASSTTEPVTCCVFLEGVASNTKKMHQVLKALLPPDHLRDVFSRIFAFVDTKVPALLIAASEREDYKFSFPVTDSGKRQLLFEVQAMIDSLNGLEGVLAWDFTAVSVLERRLEIRLHDKDEPDVHQQDLPNEHDGGNSDPSELPSALENGPSGDINDEEESPVQAVVEMNMSTAQSTDEDEMAETDPSSSLMETNVTTASIPDDFEKTGTDPASTTSPTKPEEMNGTLD